MKKMYQYLIGVVLIAAVAGYGIYYGVNQQLADDELVIVEDEEEYTEFFFNCTDPYNFITIDEFNVTEYTVENADELTEEQIAALEYSDFTAQAIKEVDAEDGFDIEDDEIQAFYISATGMSSEWVFPEAAGMYNVQLVNQSSDIELLAMETDLSGTTLNQTNEDEWTFTCRAASADTDFVEGWDSNNYDWENDVYDYLCFRIQCNTTAEDSFVEDHGDAYIEKVSGVYIYLYLLEDCLDDQVTSLDIVFDSDELGVDFEVIGAAVMFGNLDSTLTSYGTQN